MQNKNPQSIHPLTAQARQYLDSGDLDNAAKAYNTIFSQEPYNIEASEKLGFIMIKKGNYEMAEKIFRHCINVHPNNAPFHNSLGNVCSAQGKQEEALIYAKKASELDPRNYIYYQNIGSILSMKGDLKEAVESYERSLELSPDNIQSLQAMGDLMHIYSPTEAQFYLEKLSKLKPGDNNIKIGAATFIESLFKNQNEIDAFRAGLLGRINNLLAQNLKIDDLSSRIYLNHFYLAYHARNNRELKSKLAELYINSTPEINYTAPHIANYKFDKNKKIKIGFLSAFFQKHPVSICFNGLIIELAKDPRFDVHIFFIDGLSGLKKKGGDDYIRKLISFIPPENLKVFREDFFNIRDTTAKAALDILIYPDIGMYWLAYLIALTRLAPIQAHLPGHPDTSGSRNIDYYLSTDDFEAPGAEEYYTEKLVRFKNIVTCIEKPQLPEKLKTRTELGLPLDKNIYYCPMKNHKFHPDFDLAIKAILEKDPNGIILFPEDTGKISKMTTKRINKNIGKKLVERIHYHPWASNIEFPAYLKESDVILDTFNFGAGTTVYYAFAVDAPIVTLPGMTSGGRVTNAAYRKMGITDLIAKDKDDYVRLAVKCASDKEFNRSIRSRINAAKEGIYNDVSAVAEMKEFFISALEKFS